MTPFDDDDGRCEWCGERLSHTTDCAWAKRELDEWADA